MAAKGAKARRNARVDYLVIGSGIAGLRAAIELAAAGRVLVLSKVALTESATQYAQGGIAAALSDEDEIGLHYQDTLNAGDGLCHAEAVKVLVEEGPRYIQQLIEWGTRFDRQGTKLAFTREGAHSRSRVLHAHGDSTGREILRALFARARRLGKIEFWPNIFTVDLLLDDGRVWGVCYLDEATGALHALEAPTVLLATGGLGQVYSDTTNPEVATGDGVAIAYRAGAALSDLEFVQFHPTALYAPGAPRFLLTEALRGEGAVLRNVELHRFVNRYHEAAELAPRDIVSRAIITEMQRTSSELIYLDLTPLDPDFVRKRFPRIYDTCLQYNLDITTDLIPVRPAAHYAMGGIQADLWGRTAIPGLFAAGEVACTGVHGANRLASNSLLEGLVFGARAGQAMAETQPPPRQRRARPTTPPPRPELEAFLPCSGSLGGDASAPAAGEIEALIKVVRQTMWNKVGIVRAGQELQGTLNHFQRLPAPSLRNPSRRTYELANLLIVAHLIAQCALAREESRGSHYRSDFPFKVDERWRKHSLVARSQPVTFV